MMRTAIAAFVAALIGLPGLAQAAPAPLVLPHPPPVTNATSGLLAGALLQIWQAQQVNPGAAQTAAFAYTQAVQRYRGGDLAGATAAVRRALIIAGQAQVAPLEPPAPLVTPAPFARGQLPGLAGGLYGADAPAIDADAFLALARGTIAACAARHDRRLTAARAFQAAAERDFADRNWEATRVDAKAAIDACPQLDH